MKTMGAQEAINRVSKFVETRENVRCMDPQEIAAVNPGCDEGAVLTLADLEALLMAAATARHAMKPSASCLRHR